MVLLLVFVFFFCTFLYRLGGFNFNLYYPDKMITPCKVFYYRSIRMDNKKYYMWKASEVPQPTTAKLEITQRVVLCTQMSVVFALNRMLSQQQQQQHTFAR